MARPGAVRRVATRVAMRRRRSRRLPGWQRWTLVVALLLALLGALVVNAPRVTDTAYSWRFGPRVDALPAAAGFAADDRVLLVAPHPDDESLCCAGLLQQALAASAQVWVVWLTSGDGFELDAMLTERTLAPGDAGLERLGERRTGEALRAAAVLGIPAERLIFLGYPDAGLQRLFLDYYYEPYRSSYTGLTAVAYPNALSPGAAFTGENLLADLTTVFERVAPTVVLAPSPEDRHPDHRTAGDLALRILGERGEVARARWWIVHGGLEWPLPKGLRPGLPLFPPPRGAGLPWQRVDLSPPQVAGKLDALRAYETQMEFERRFMEAFVRRNELVAADPLPAFGTPHP